MPIMVLGHPNSGIVQNGENQIIKYCIVSSSLTVSLVIRTSHILQDCVLEANYETTHIRTILKFFMGTKFDRSTENIK